MYKKLAKPEELPISQMIKSVVTDENAAGFQPRNLMPLKEEVIESYKHAGQWDPSKPAVYVVHEGQTYILDGNTRTRYAAAAGFTTGWFQKATLENDDSLIEIMKNRARSNIFTKSDPWTQAETFKAEFDQDLTHEEIAKNHGVSVTTVRKHLRMYDLVKSLGPKPKAEETPEQTEARVDKAEEAQEAIIAGIRSGTVSALDIERVLAKDMDNDAFDKAIKNVTRPKKEKVAAQTETKRAETLDEYERLGVPTRFLPDLRAQVISRSTGLSQPQISAAVGLVDTILGILPLENFLAGNFTPPAKEEETVDEGSDDDAAEAQATA